jgi:hypothetical protein
MFFSLAVLSTIGFFAVGSAVHRHHIASCPPFSLGSFPCRVRASRLHGTYSKVIHSARAEAAMWGTQTVHFRPAAPLLSLLTPFLTLTKMIKMNFNVIKCNHLYGQLPVLTASVLRPSSFVFHPSSFVPAHRQN